MWGHTTDVGFSVFLFFLFFLGQTYISRFFVILEETGNAFMVYKTTSKMITTNNKNNFSKLKFTLL